MRIIAINSGACFLKRSPNDTGEPLMISLIIGHTYEVENEYVAEQMLRGHNVGVSIAIPFEGNETHPWRPHKVVANFTKI